MDVTVLYTWLVRWGHVVGGGTWVGGYLLTAFVIIPIMAQHRHESLFQLAIATVRLMTYSGMATIFLGILLIIRTRGFAYIVGGYEWGLIIVVCIVIAIALLGIGDGALRPALRRLANGESPRPAQRMAYIGFVLTLLAVGLMTRAIYAR
jgi:lysylphosphatidylglycerol synthetase-like protein (DUF2156 family)